MDIEVKLEKNPEILAKLNKSVHELQQSWYPTIFRKYNYDTMYKMFDEMYQNDSVYSLIAYSSNQPVGYALLIIRHYDNPLFCESHQSIYIDQICVLEEYRHNGVGKLLMEKINEFSKSKDIKRIELSVWAENINAIKFFERMGFTNYLYNMCCKLD
jgi:ribosomal protein S18 acetylase RimI-like enzyme